MVRPIENRPSPAVKLTLPSASALLEWDRVSFAMIPYATDDLMLHIPGKIIDRRWSPIRIHRSWVLSLSVAASHPVPNVRCHRPTLSGRSHGQRELFD